MRAPSPHHSPTSDEASPPRRGAPAWLFSVVLHATLCVALGVLGPLQHRPRAIEPDRPAGITLVGPTRVAPEFANVPDTPAASQTAPSELPSASAAAAAATPAVELPGPLPAGAGTGSALATLSAGDMTSGVGRASRITGGQGTTSVFGASAAGSKFIYVFDRSESMAGFGGRPMKAARTELLASLGKLQSVHQFQIVFYNHDLTVFNPWSPRPPVMMFASEENQQLAQAFVAGVVPLGSTRHFQALELALRLQPDVIFFLTDAAEPQLTPAQLQRVRRQNSGASIHTIEFGAGPFSGGSNFLVRLARENAGQHVYVDVTRLGAGRRDGS